MANRLKVAMLQALVTLWRRGWSRRRIARELGVDRETVGRYVRRLERLAKPAIAHTGSVSAPVPEPIAAVAKPAIVLTGSCDPESIDAASKPAIVHTGSAALSDPTDIDSLVQLLSQSDRCGDPDYVPRGRVGRRSDCEPFRDIIQAKLAQGLSAQRIYQDLVTEHGFAQSYHSVRRFVRRLLPETAAPFRRVETAPGEQVQVDFGKGAPVIGPDGKRHRTHVFRVVLSHSRKAYSEVTLRQTTEAFLSCLENAFAHFGGVPKTIVLDNLRAAVQHADWFDPELVPKVQAFATHYGTVFLPTKPYTPRHKGKVERGIDYVQENALKGHAFASVAEQNRHLQHWEQTVADTRIHGTTRQQVGKVFREGEQATLLPLPAERFPDFREAERMVHRDGHIEVDRAYYSVPLEYLGRKVWVRWDTRLIRIFNQRFTQIALHARHLPGSFSTQDAHIPTTKHNRLDQGAKALLQQARHLGPRTGAWAQAMLQDRGIPGLRVLLGLLSLAKRHPRAALEEACDIAYQHGAYRLRTLRHLVQRQEPAPAEREFLDRHPLIRDLADYGRLVDGTGPEPDAPVVSAVPPAAAQALNLDTSLSVIPASPQQPC